MITEDYCSDEEAENFREIFLDNLKTWLDYDKRREIARNCME